MTRNPGSRIVLAGLLAATLVGWTSAQAAPASAPAAGRGAALYISKGCYQCHGRAAQGAMGVGPALSPSMAPLAYFSAYIRAPGGQMPPYSPTLLPQAELEDIFTYLHALPKAPGAAQIPILAPYVAKPCDTAVAAATCAATRTPPR